jgi:heptosyltransferase-2
MTATGGKSYLNFNYIYKYTFKKRKSEVRTELKRQRRILIVRQDRVGDVVVTTAIPREIKEQWPDSYVAVLVSFYTKDIYLNNPYVDEIIINEDLQWKGAREFFSRVSFIRRFKFTHALMLLPSESINYLLFLSGIRHRYGVGYKFYQFITFVKGISRHKYIPLRHEADYCMDLARAIGIKSSNIIPEIYLSGEEREKVRNIRKYFTEDGKIAAGIHSTSGKSSPNISVSSYLRIIKELQKTGLYKIIITDNNVPELLQNLEGVDYPNRNSGLRDSILNLAALDFLVSASTGPMHIAAALRVNTISMFCTLTACSPILWGPLGNDSIIITPDDNYCGNKCSGDPKSCMFENEGGIEIQKIIDSINLVSKKIRNKNSIKTTG